MIRIIERRILGQNKKDGGGGGEAGRRVYVMFKMQHFHVYSLGSKGCLNLKQTQDEEV